MNPQTLLIRALAANLPPSHAECIETHISWVVLAGEYAYKIKKPVNLGFLDFSTLEKRRFFCEEEVRLNRRLAPEIYLDVVGIGGTPEHPVLNGGVPAMEYAVKMRRFGQEQMLPEQLAAGKLEARHIDALTESIARFHAAIPRAATGSPLGAPEAVRAPALENFTQIRPLLRDPADISRIEALRGWTEREFTARRSEFAARQAEGFVRECHGDMHLGNMVLIDGNITIFDCIEFNPSLRWIDVMSEAAFLVMDLIERGNAAFAWRFLNGYLSITGDYAGLSVLRFYLVYRAMVRAKVAAIRAGQSGSHEAWREYGNYISLAESLSQRRQPKLIITHGLSGSGKTTLTQPVLEALGAIRIRSDVERKRLFGLAAHEKSGSGIDTGLYGREAGERTFARLAELTRAILSAGYPVIVDATFIERRRRNDFRRIAEDMRLPFAILDFQASEATLRARVARREAEGRDASEATLEVLTRQLAAREPLGADELSCTVPIDAEAATIDAETIARIAAHPKGHKGEGLKSPLPPGEG